MHGYMHAAIYALLKELEGGKRKMNELKQSAPLYGTAFDWAVTALLSTGLAKRTMEGGAEYLEITDMGRSLLSGPWSTLGWGPNWGWGRGRRGCW